MKIAVDIDDTIVKQEEDFDITEFGIPLPNAIEALNKLRLNGWTIILHSCRTTPDVNPGYDLEILKMNVMMWADENGVPYDDVWVGEGKPLADVYLDNKAMEFHGDWKLVMQKLEALQEDQ
jgi:hypothetical protein